ncbi:MAG: arylsulfatase [Thermoguttaceae bacterium]|jgi:arylsulfatase A-like enzyme|nr:arylsulfatase [Thermoguttaceae bacterium]
MRPILFLLGIAAAGLHQQFTVAAEPVKPNIIYILADDLGYGDLGCYGQELIRTPRIDRMAAEGMRFTQHYSGAPSCQPSRCVLFTGLHTGHARLRFNSKRPLLPEDFTVAEMLKQAGYVTGGVGKWGLGAEDTTGAPWRKGMDEFFGYLDQTHAHTYYPDHLWRNDQRVDIPENRDGNRVVYSHDLLTDEALDFIRRHHDRPFFFYGAFTIPHAEMVVPDDALAEYLGRWPEPKPFPGSRTYCAQDRPRAVRAAMITRLDRDVGRIFDLLDELGIAENTLVLFTSDNGPITAGGQDPEFFNSAGPLRGLKFSLYEGGIRVPMIARWPGRIAPGSETPLVSDFADMLPTFAEVAGATAPAGLDGVSILPTLLGRSADQVKREVFYWEAAPQQAVRVGDWKLYRRAPDRPAELYDLASDIGESRSVADQHPEIAARLAQLLSDSRVDSPDFPLVRERK